MKRMSKREMKFRLGPAGKVRVRIERIERGHAAAALETAIEPWEAFARRHPAGSLVEAEVLAVSPNKIRLRFEGGLQTRMSIGDYWDRWPPCGRDDRMKLHVPNRIEVIVRRLEPGRRILSVSMHGYSWCVVTRAGSCRL